MVDSQDRGLNWVCQSGKGPCGLFADTIGGKFLDIPRCSIGNRSAKPSAAIGNPDSPSGLGTDVHTSVPRVPAVDFEALTAGKNAVPWNASSNRIDNRPNCPRSNIPNPPIFSMTAESLSDASDQTLVRAVRNGDQRAATELYDRYARRAFGLVYTQMSNWLATVTEPDDIVQSVFKSVFRGVTSGRYEAPEGNTLWSLIAVIAVRKTTGRARHHSATIRDSNRNVPLESLGDSELAQTYDCQGLALDFKETLESLRESDQRVLLARIQGHSVEEIADRIGRTTRTVERSLQRIREKLADFVWDELK